MALRAEGNGAEGIDDRVARLDERSRHDDENHDTRTRDLLERLHAATMRRAHIGRGEQEDAGGGQRHHARDHEDHRLRREETNEPAAEGHEREHADRTRAAHDSVVEKAFARHDAAARLAQHDGVGERDHRPLAEGAGDDAEKDEAIDGLHEARGERGERHRDAAQTQQPGAGAAAVGERGNEQIGQEACDRRRALDQRNGFGGEADARIPQRQERQLHADGREDQEVQRGEAARGGAGIQRGGGQAGLGAGRRAKPS